jgi:hypothetical protein
VEDAATAPCELEGTAMTPKPKYIVIPEIAGRLIVGESPKDWIARLNAELAVTHWIQVITDENEKPIIEDYDGAMVDWTDEKGRLKALVYYMRESNQVGTKFYMFPSPVAWEMAAAALMARYGWTARYTAAAIDNLTGLTFDLKEVEATYKAWLEKGTGQR